MSYMSEMILFVSQIGFALMKLIGYLTLLVYSFLFINSIVSTSHYGNDKFLSTTLILFLAIFFFPVHYVIVNNLPTLNFNIYEFVGFNAMMVLGIFLLVKLCMKVKSKQYSGSFEKLSRFTVYIFYLVFITITLSYIKDTGGEANPLRFLAIFATWVISNLFISVQINQIEFDI